MGITDIALKKAAETEGILLEIYKDLAQPGVKKVGLAMETVFDFATMPLHLLRFGSEAARLNYEIHLQNYRKKLENIPEEKIVSISPEIGVPILEKLSYTTSEDIANLFTSLLAKASNEETANAAHPSFIQIIERLSVDDAKIIRRLVNNPIIVYSTLNASIKNETGYNTILKYATMIEHEITSLHFPNNIAAYLDNLMSLGIIKDMSGYSRTNTALYDPIKNKFALTKASVEALDRFSSADWVDSYFEVSTFGKLFISACS